MEQPSKPFWKTKPLEALSPEEWESLCDGCGRCCLVKLEEEETGDTYFTDVACFMLECHSCQCSDYEHRKRHVPDCVTLTPELIREVVLLYIRYPLSLRNVEDLLAERGYDLCHETVRLWWNRFGPMFADDIRRQRVSRMRGFRHWRWHVDEMWCCQSNGASCAGRAVRGANSLGRSRIPLPFTSY